MKKEYIAPAAELLCFRPVEELAAIDLIQPGPGEAAKHGESDILITL